jgi:hypothetical protein
MFFLPLTEGECPEGTRGWKVTPTIFNKRSWWNNLDGDVALTDPSVPSQKK